jgi:hypothetical protein
MAFPFKRCSPVLWSEHMNGFEFPLFLFATFAGAFVAGLSGFAFRDVAAALWLYFPSPLPTTTLIVAFGLIVQDYSVRSLRRSLDWQKLWPFLLGATIGIPVGVTLLTDGDPHKLRVGIGVARRERNRDARNSQIVSDRSFFLHRGNVARTEAFRKIERSGISKARACAAVRLGCGFELLAS